LGTCPIDYATPRYQPPFIRPLKNPESAPAMPIGIKRCNLTLSRAFSASYLAIVNGSLVEIHGVLARSLEAREKQKYTSFCAVSFIKLASIKQR